MRSSCNYNSDRPNLLLLPKFCSSLGSRSSRVSAIPMYLLSLRWILLDVPLAASAIEADESDEEDVVEKLLD